MFGAKIFFNNLNQLDWIDEEFTTLPGILVNNYQADSIRKAIINLIEKQNFFVGRGFPYTQ